MSGVTFSTIESILSVRKDRCYRCGLIQAFRMCDALTQEQWRDLKYQIDAGVKEPRVKRG